MHSASTLHDRSRKWGQGFDMHMYIFRYGKVFKTHLFFSPTVVSCDQELNYFILQNEDKLFQCSYPKPIHGILGEVSMLVAVGDTHRRLRNVALSLVATIKSKPEFLGDIERIAVEILDSWKGRQQVMFCAEARKVFSSTCFRNKKSRNTNKMHMY